MATRWNNKDLDGDFFAWLAAWRSVSRLAPSRAHRNCTVQQLLSTKVYQHEKKDWTITWCHMLKSPRRTCWLAARHWRRPNTSLGTILFELLKKTDNIPPWFSPTERKPAGENQRTKAYWDVPVYAQNTEVRVNTMNVRIINNEDKKVTLLEMSCPWMENREAKESEKTMRLVPLRRFWVQDAEVTQGW